MRRNIVKLSGLILLLGTIATAVTPRAEAKKVCNLLCVQGLKCCIVHGQPACVPESQVCHP